MKKVIKVDKNGLFVEDVIIKEDEKVPIDCIEYPCQNGFYTPKWTGTEWVEGLSQNEIDNINNRLKEPTADDYLIDLDYRLSMIELGI